MQRVLLYIPIMLLVTILVFLLMRVIPGDPALLILAGTSGDGSFKKEDLLKLRAELGTDRPLHVQYGAWLWGLVHGDLGISLFYRTPIKKELAPRVPATLELAFLAVLISVLLAVPLGALSAVKQGSTLDYVTRMFTRPDLCHSRAHRQPRRRPPVCLARSKDTLCLKRDMTPWCPSQKRASVSDAGTRAWLR